MNQPLARIIRRGVYVPQFDVFSPVLRWTPFKKLELLRAVESGYLALAEALRIHSLSGEEWACWQARQSAGGRSGLRVTRRLA